MIDKILLLLGLQRIKNKKCEHEYYCSSELDSYTNSYTDVYIYCPKCSAQKYTSYYNWIIIEKQQKIKKEYLKNIWKLDGINIDEAIENLNKSQNGEDW